MEIWTENLTDIKEKEWKKKEEAGRSEETYGYGIHMAK